MGMGMGRRGGRRLPLTPCREGLIGQEAGPHGVLLQDAAICSEDDEAGDGLDLPWWMRWMDVGVSLVSQINLNPHGHARQTW